MFLDTAICFALGGIMKHVIFTLAIAMTACAVDPTTTPTTPTTPTTQTTPSLGIARFQIDEQATTLKITGFDAHNAPVGYLWLSTGKFISQDDGTMMDGRQ